MKQIFEWCHKYGISLNPKKIIFGQSEETLLGHIIAKRKIKFDIEREKSITQISFPMNKKDMQYFLGKINFLRKFVSDCA